jgi:hypothetical protein
VDPTNAWHEAARSLSIKRRRANGSNLGHGGSFYEDRDGRFCPHALGIVKFDDRRSDRFEGEFDFTLQPDDYKSPDVDVKLADRLRSSAESLGFRFVGEKVKVDYVTIDGAEMPDAN